MKVDFGSASILQDGRVVFNIAGNKYRLVAWINHPYRWSTSDSSVTIASTTRLTTRAWREDSMDIKPIHTEADYRATLREIETLMTATAFAGRRTSGCARDPRGSLRASPLPQGPS